MTSKTGRRKAGRIRTHPARQQRRARKVTRNQAAHGHPVPGTVALLEAVPKLPQSWLESIWSDGAPFRAMAHRHAVERARGSAA
jgi:hypothetical protein